MEMKQGLLNRYEDDSKVVKYNGIKAMPFIIGNETFEKLGTIGTSNNLLVYLTTVFHMTSIQATYLVNIFNGTSNFATLIGAYLSDTFFGRYSTLGFASVSSFLGMLLLTLTAAVSKLHPPQCTTEVTEMCTGPSSLQMTILISSLVFLVIGAGGIRPCNLAFGADQFNPNTESGKRGISTFFNWYYFTYTFAMIVSLTVIVYVQVNVSWAIGLAVPMGLMFLSCVFFFIGTPIYVRVGHGGSPMKNAEQVLLSAFRKRKVALPDFPELNLYNHVSQNSINSKLPYTDQFRWLDKAAVLTADDELNADGSLTTDPWRLCSMQKVEEVKCMMRIIPIWATLILYYPALVQQDTYAVFQALQSDRRFGNGSSQIPAATYTIFTMISLTLWIPIYDRLIIPTIRKYTKNESAITHLQKIGTGMILAIFSMFISGIIESKRRETALKKPAIGLDSNGNLIASFSAFWLVPQLALAGVSQAFTIIGHSEFYYKQFPENMRSIGGSLLYVGMALGGYLVSVLVWLIDEATTMTTGSRKGSWMAEDLNKGRLDYFYNIVGLLGVLNLVVFLVFAKWYRYKGTSGGDLLC